METYKHVENFRVMVKDICLDNKTVWLYMLGKLKHIDRTEVEAFYQNYRKNVAVPDDGNNSPPGEYYSVYKIWSDANERKLKAPVLKHVCLSYDLSTTKAGEEAFHFKRVADVLAGSTKPLKDLYSLETTKDVCVHCQFKEGKWQERFSLTYWGETQVWALDYLLGGCAMEDTIRKLQKQKDLMDRTVLIITDRDSAHIELVSRSRMAA